MKSILLSSDLNDENMEHCPKREICSIGLSQLFQPETVVQRPMAFRLASSWHTGQLRLSAGNNLSSKAPGVADDASACNEVPIL